MLPANLTGGHTTTAIERRQHRTATACTFKAAMAAFAISECFCVDKGWLWRHLQGVRTCEMWPDTSTALAHTQLAAAGLQQSDGQLIWSQRKIFNHSAQAGEGGKPGISSPAVHAVQFCIALPFCRQCTRHKASERITKNYLFRAVFIAKAYNRQNYYDAVGFRQFYKAHSLFHAFG